MSNAEASLKHETPRGQPAKCANYGRAYPVNYKEAQNHLESKMNQQQGE